MKRFLFLVFGLTPLTVFAQDLYDINNVTTIEITFSDPNWDQTMDTYYANDMDEKLLGTATVNGVFFDSVGVKYKGNSTYNANNAKNPLNIDLDYIINQDYAGYATLKLSSGKNDPSFVREVLSYEIARKYMDAPLSNYATVYINGSFYGVFSSSESVNGDFMERYLTADSKATRVKCNPESVFGGNGSSLEYLGADSSLYYTSYEMKSDFGWSDLVDLTDTLVNNVADIETALDIDRAIWMLAFDNVLVSLDSYLGPFRQNYYLIHDRNQRIVPVVWDMNESLGGFEMINSGGPPGGVNDLINLDPYLRQNETTWPLIKMILDDPTYTRMYIAHCRTMLSENFSNGWYLTEANALQGIIGPDVAAEPNNFYSYTEFQNNINNSVGTGPGSTVGITQLMDSRVTFLENHTAWQYTVPTITVPAFSPAAPIAGSTVTITSTVTNASSVIIGHRSTLGGIFQKEPMFDDGNHGDGAASDGVYGVQLTLAASGMQYYIYAENTDAGMFEPARAEHEFHSIQTEGGVVLNEMMASNNTTQADQDGEFDDWIELYNNGSVAVDLTAYSLTDNPANPTKWVFPTASIAANDYLIVWADQDSFQTGLHAHFKLSSGGETVQLYNPSGGLVDETTFLPLASDMTHGRFPNGTGPFITMGPTFAAENSDAVSVAESLQNELGELFLYPNPVGASQWLEVKSSDFETVQWNIFDLSGKRVMSGSFNGSDRIQTGNWQAGMYVFVAEGYQPVKLVVSR